MKPRQIPYPLLLLIVAATYFGAAEVGLSQAFLHTNVSPVWPPTGVAIAAVWLLGYRISPAILLGAFLANLATAVPAATAGGIAVGNTLEAVTAVFLLRRFVGPRSPFYRAQDAGMFVLIAGALSTTVSATLGNISLCLSGAAAW
jgi:integral membrane sensor domain MASE1